MRQPQQPIEKEIKTLREIVPQLLEQLRLDNDVDITTWQALIDKKLLPKLAPDFPLVASICGGGSSGKSSLFNALIQDNISPTGGTAGINRRILISGNVDSFSDGSRFADLFNAFGFRPEPLMDKNDLIRQGNARYVLNTQTPSNLILLDTPDFDTGLKGTYLNREVARQALEVSDVLVYIFTNANYNNRDNTDFISEILTGIGIRKCFLVYRVYAGYPDEEILEHAGTVAENLYGSDAANYILGVYRADEDNRVAADEIFMDLLPVGDGGVFLMDALASLDREKTRLALMSSILMDVLEQAGEISNRAGVSLLEMGLYRNALQTWQSHCVHQALKRFPMDIVLKRFVEIWHRTDPSHIRWMRKAGNIIDLPIRAAVKTVKWIRGRESRLPGSEKNSQVRYSEETMDDLLTAANDLRRKFIDSEISVSLAKTDPVAKEMHEAYQGIEAQLNPLTKGNPHQMRVTANGDWNFIIRAHPAIFDEGRLPGSGEWRPAITSILSSTEKLLDTSGQIDRDLETLVETFRKRMNLLSKIGQTFSAFLNVLPATVAVTYILSTGDPVGAAGIKVKLSGLFGLKDLYALVALPATSGLRTADQAQLEALMGPIAETWLNHKLEVIQTIFQDTISGETLEKAEGIYSEADRHITDLNRVLVNCRTYIEQGTE
ncbi:hypothetical protein ACFL2E_04200 [Thermodesulfobacteriota bacterium]